MFYLQYPTDFPLSSSELEDERAVRVVCVNDGGSQAQSVRVLFQGMPVVGIIVSGAEITTMGIALFKKVAAAARLWKRDFWKSDKFRRGYDQCPLRIDGRMDLDVSFQE